MIDRNNLKSLDQKSNFLRLFQNRKEKFLIFINKWLYRYSDGESCPIFIRKKLNFPTIFFSQRSYNK